MKYELWEVCSFGEAEFQAMILNKSFDDFRDAYFEFQKLIKSTPCCIILNNKGENK